MTKVKHMTGFWELIEKAPRDGTELLVWIPTKNGGSHEIVASDRSLMEKATHWMWLPEPPTVH